MFTVSKGTTPFRVQNSYYLFHDLSSAIAFIDGLHPSFNGVAASEFVPLPLRDPANLYSFAATQDVSHVIEISSDGTKQTISVDKYLEQHPEAKLTPAEINKIDRSFPPGIDESRSAEQRFQRLTVVLSECGQLAHWVQVKLSNAAGIMTIATLAEHPERDHCSAYFFSIVDMAYAIVAPSLGIRRQIECEHIRASAMAVHEHVKPKIEHILMSAQESLACIDPDHPNPVVRSARLAAESLVSLRHSFVEFAPNEMLMTTVMACHSLCCSIELLFNGLDVASTVLVDASKVSLAATECCSHVIGCIERGQLIVVDGKIRRPAT
jgi:hypothetical protein